MCLSFVTALILALPRDCLPLEPTNTPRARVGFLAGIESRGEVRCSGFFYKANIVVTAATCVLGYRGDFQVREDAYGALNTTARFGIVRKVIHPRYGYDVTPAWNIAVLFLDRAKAPYKRVKLNSEWGSGLLAPGLKLTGWKLSGPLQDPVAAMATLPLKLQPTVLCSASHLQPLDRTHEFCAGAGNSGLGACAFLAGSPLHYAGLVKPVIVGIISWNRPCALLDLAPIFTSMASVEEWLTQISENPSLAFH